MHDRFISRRDVLSLALAAAGTLVRPMRAVGLVTAAGQSVAGSGVARSRLVIRNARPLDAESPLDGLRTFETSNDLFFVRSHHSVLPDISTPWTLTIDGEVARPVTFPTEARRV